MGLGGLDIDAFEEGQEALVRRLGGDLFSVVAYAEKAQLPPKPRS
jgi:hypothetical protein